MLVYPAHMSFPIMDNSGLPPAPEGMLLVKVLRGEKLKGKEMVGKIDPFVQVGIFCCCTGVAVDELQESATGVGTLVRVVDGGAS